MAGLIVRKQDGNVLFDTQYITHGLVKSGYLQADEGWSRYILKGINVDPNLGSSYNQTATTDQMWSISIPNAQSPICFIVGKGYAQGSTTVGGVTKFFFQGADGNTKAYVFDLMADTIPGSPPWLKCRNQAGRITFNSLQTPLNILGSIQAPGPVQTDQFGRYVQPHAGATWQAISQNGANSLPTAHSVTNIALSSGIEYAVSISFTRICQGYWSATGDGGLWRVGMSEGAYGRVGGISFMFGPAGGTTQFTGGSMSSGFTVDQIPTDRYPTALVITTGNLPFPFN